MNELRNQQTSRNSGFRNSSIWWLFALLIVGTFSAMVLGRAARAQQPDTITAERINENVALFTWNGKQYMGFDLEESKRLKKAENDSKIFGEQLQLCKNNEQDHKLRYSKLETLYGEQSLLFQSCMKLSKTGSSHGLLDNFWVRLGIDAAPTVTNFVRKCN